MWDECEAGCSHSLLGFFLIQVDAVGQMDYGVLEVGEAGGSRSLLVASFHGA